MESDQDKLARAMNCIDDINALLYDDKGDERDGVSGADFMQEVTTYLQNYGFGPNSKCLHRINLYNIALPENEDRFFECACELCGCRGTFSFTGDIAKIRWGDED